MGGCIRNVLLVWGELIGDQWVLQIIRLGYCEEFLEPPLEVFWSTPSLPVKSQALLASVHDLSSKGATCEGPGGATGKGGLIYLFSDPD